MSSSPPSFHDIMDMMNSFSTLPSKLYHTMGPFGRIMTAPLWIMFLPLTYLGAWSILIFPLWFLFLACLPLLALVIGFEHVTHEMTRLVSGRDLCWMRQQPTRPLNHHHIRHPTKTTTTSTRSSSSTSSSSSSLRARTSATQQQLKAASMFRHFQERKR